MLSSVDLPDPEGPEMAVYSPSFTVTSMPCSTGTGWAATCRRPCVMPDQLDDRAGLRSSFRRSRLVLPIGRRSRSELSALGIVARLRRTSSFEEVGWWPGSGCTAAPARRLLEPFVTSR